MTLEKIKARHDNAEENRPPFNELIAEETWAGICAPVAHSDRAQLIEWVERMLPYVRGQADTWNPAADLLHEITGQEGK